MKRELNVFLANPRGFCTGVKRAISIVEQEIEESGKPVYVKHEIVHNKHVLDDLRKKGAVFIESFDEIENRNAPVILSAHGVSKLVIKEANEKGLKIINAICPLVEKIHKQIKKFYDDGMQIIVIGKKEHPEIIGTIGQLDELSNVHIINSIEQARELQLDETQNIGVVTQTTLSVFETQKIIEYLQTRFGKLATLQRNDICYATTHRQLAIKELVKKTPNIIVIGSKNSSNSIRLKEAALSFGADNAWLVDDVLEVDFDELKKFSSLGISAGASAPEYLVENLLDELKKHYENINIQNVIVTKENSN